MLSWLPENVSTYGARIDAILELIYYIVGIWFLAVMAVLVYFIIRYRRREGVRAVYEPGTRFKALAWILVPALLILGFDLWIDWAQGPVWNDIKLTTPITDQTVRINGRQFVWEFTIPGVDNQLDTVDDIQTLNQLTVPVHTKILFELSASDVIHSLWIPNLRLKQDAVPGRTIRGWFEVNREGSYPIACAELCGSGHGLMKGELHVLGPDAYRQWLQTQELQEVSGVSH